MWQIDPIRLASALRLRAPKRRRIRPPRILEISQNWNGVLHVSVLLLRGRRGDSDGLISFNLMPAPPSEEPVAVPGRVSETRMLLVHYWRRDQQAMAEAEAAELNAPAAASSFDEEAPGVFVNGELVRAPRPAAEPLPLPPPAYDPNRPDFLSSLKSRVRQQRTAATDAANGPLFVDETGSPAFTADAPRAASPAASLFSEPGEPAAAPESKASSSSLFAESPLSEAERLIQENLAILAGPRPEPAKPDLVVQEPAVMQASAPAEAVVQRKPVLGRQAKVNALESFLRRVASRRQQIESESVA
jgi:hypothetical protein